MLAWAWGMSQSGSMHMGGGGGAGRSTCGPVVHQVHRQSTPNLMMACSSGKHYPQAKLTIRKAGGENQVEYLIITLKEVPGVLGEHRRRRWRGSPDRERDPELRPGQVDYQPQKADGAKDGSPVKYGWNIRQNVQA
ncbi:type VI secretion system tube protein Hcp [Pseudomonas aeruginosa]